MEKNSLKSVIESLLFVSGEPIKLAKLAKICNTPKNNIEEAIKELIDDFAREERGLTVILKGDSAQIATSPKNAEYVNQLVSGEMSADLSRSSLETLSIVAYRGPVTRLQVEAIRGVNCSYVLRNLLIRGLVERKESADIRGYLYEVSFEFLKKIGVSSMKNLPDWENLSKHEKVEEILQINTQETEKDGQTENA